MPTTASGEFYLATALIALVGLPVLVSREATVRYAQMWGRVCLWLLRVVGGTRLEFRGLEHLPAGPVLIAAKHQSTLETLALTVPLERFCYVLKRELMLIPVVGWYFARGGMVPIDRSKGTRAMALMNAAARAAIGDRRRLIVFPEGTRRPVGASPAYKQGLSHLYTALGVPCVPVALNTGLYWRRGAFLRLPGTAVIEFLPPIPPGLARLPFQAEVQARIEAATDALVAQGRASLTARGLPVPGPAEAAAGPEATPGAI